MTEETQGPIKDPQQKDLKLLSSFSQKRTESNQGKEKKQRQDKKLRRRKEQKKRKKQGNNLGGTSTTTSNSSERTKTNNNSGICFYNYNKKNHLSQNCSELQKDNNSKN